MAVPLEEKRGRNAAPFGFRWMQIWFELERKVQRHLQEARAAQRVLDQAQL
jgi:hypothetical protein